MAVLMATTPTEPGAGRPPLALLVDRDADARQMYAEFLRYAAFEIDQAEEGREALVKALTRPPDVIVTETQLPGISGLELCRILRHDAATANIPFVFVTGDAFEREVKRAQAAGADAVLIKPCLPERLAEEIRHVLARSHELRSRARTLHEKIGAQLARSERLIGESQDAVHRVTLSHAHQRRETSEPPLTPPIAVCPACDREVKYLKSFIGGV